MPAPRLDHARPAVLVEVFDAHRPCARNEGREARDAQAPFEELAGVGERHRELRIDDRAEGDGRALPFREPTELGVSQVLLAILDDGELQRLSDLWGGQTHARRIAHGVAHALDEALDGVAADLLRRELASRGAEQRLADLQDARKRGHVRARRVGRHRADVVGGSPVDKSLPGGSIRKSTGEVLFKGDPCSA